MTQNSSPWDGILTGDAANAPYSAIEWARLWAKLSGLGTFFPNYGVIPGTGDGTYPALQIRAAGSANVDVKVGAALVYGQLYETDTAITLTVGANASGNPRIDTTILRADYTAQTIRPVLKQGTPAVSPARPSLQQDSSIWELPLADIAVANGFSTINQADITDRRRAIHNAHSGWRPYVYPDNFIHNAAYSAGGVTLTGMGFPISVVGNMLVQQLQLRSLTTGTINFLWGVYTESLNDLGTTDKNLQLIGGRTTTASIGTTNGQNAIIPADAPFYLPPGHYWLIVQIGSAFSQPTITPTTFEGGLNSMYTNTGAFSFGQSINLTSGFTKDVVSMAARLDGRVFGAAAAF